MLHSGAHPGESGIRGNGVIALRDIPVGTVIWGPCEQCRTWTEDEQAEIPPAVVNWLDEFGYRLADRSLILPCRGACLMNHSCEANVLDYGLAVGVAVRDIAAGDEMTCDYRTFRYDGPWEFACACGSPRCLGMIRSRPGEYPSELVAHWQQQLTLALPAAKMAEQEISLRSGSVTAARLVCVP
jgi:hypothetical protein